MVVFVVVLTETPAVKIGNCRSPSFNFWHVPQLLWLSMLHSFDTLERLWATFVNLGSAFEEGRKEGGLAWGLEGGSDGSLSRGRSPEPLFWDEACNPGVQRVAYNLQLFLCPCLLELGSKLWG